MNEDLWNELEAINSIYGSGSLVITEDANTYILNLPQHATALRLHFPGDYPSSPPTVLGSQSSGDRSRKGEAAHVVDLFRNALGVSFQPGEVCMFDVIEALIATIPHAQETLSQDLHATEETTSHAVFTTSAESQTESPVAEEQPPWTISDAVTESKSIFVARAAPVSSPDQATRYLQHLLDGDKRIRSATHNITAWRIKGENGITFQDCDDDGETAAGGRLLHLMQLMELWDTMVVVTRWYGGHQLGPKRFSIINTVARDAFVKAGLVEETTSKKKGRR